MNFTILTILFLLGITMASPVPETSTKSSSISLRVVTFNIRYAATDLEGSEKPWSQRAPLVIGILRKLATDAQSSGIETVISLQEALHDQLLDIKRGLGPEWTHFGVGRDDGKKKGEYNPILYRPRVLERRRGIAKWLSKTPDRPSLGWGAGSRRLVEVVEFVHQETGRALIYANTHLDNASGEARRKGVGVALEVLKDFVKALGVERKVKRCITSSKEAESVHDTQGVNRGYGDDAQLCRSQIGIILTGDFNSQPGEEAYMAVEKDGLLEDLYNATAPVSRYGPYNTYTAFPPADEAKVGQRIDFIWFGIASSSTSLSLTEVWDIERYQAVSNDIDGVYASDHRPVVGDLQLLGC